MLSMLRLTAPAALVLVLSLASGVPRSADAGSVNSPGSAPTFSVRGLDGKTLRLSDYKGKPVVLDFWATWCVPCRASMPQLSEMQERYREQGLVVLGLALDDESPNQLRRYADQLRIRFRLGLADERVLNLYGPIRSIPTTIFINRRGEMVRRVVGYIDGETMDSYAQELFAR
jgi:thiol-disulfide isomerase/thioredoxin